MAAEGGTSKLIFNKLLFLHSKLQTSASVIEQMYSPYLPQIQQTGSPSMLNRCWSFDIFTFSIKLLYKKTLKIIFSKSISQKELFLDR